MLTHRTTAGKSTRYITVRSTATRLTTSYEAQTWIQIPRPMAGRFTRYTAARPTAVKLTASYKAHGEL